MTRNYLPQELRDFHSLRLILTARLFFPHFLLWEELFKTIKGTKQCRRKIIKKWLVYNIQ